MQVVVNSLDKARFPSQLKMNITGGKHRLADVVWDSSIQSLLDAPLACLDLFWDNHLKDHRVLGRRSVASLQNTPQTRGSFTIFGPSAQIVLSRSLV